MEVLSFVGRDLRRPECVLATESGRLVVSDWRGGVSIVKPDGKQSRITFSGEMPAGGLRPNGIALCPDGSFLLAHLGDRDGGV